MATAAARATRLSRSLCRVRRYLVIHPDKGIAKGIKI
jgi:hypothetical protein